MRKIVIFVCIFNSFIWILDSQQANVKNSVELTDKQPEIKKNQFLNKLKEVKTQAKTFSESPSKSALKSESKQAETDLFDQIFSGLLRGFLNFVGEDTSQLYNLNDLVLATANWITRFINQNQPVIDPMSMFNDTPLMDGNDHTTINNATDVTDLEYTVEILVENVLLFLYNQMNNNTDQQLPITDLFNSFIVSTVEYLLKTLFNIDLISDSEANIYKDKYYQLLSDLQNLLYENQMLSKKHTRKNILEKSMPKLINELFFKGIKKMGELKSLEHKVNKQNDAFSQSGQLLKDSFNILNELNKLNQNQQDKTKDASKSDESQAKNLISNTFDLLKKVRESEAYQDAKSNILNDLFKKQN